MNTRTQLYLPQLILLFFCFNFFSCSKNETRFDEGFSTLSTPISAKINQWFDHEICVRSGNAYAKQIASLRENINLNEGWIEELNYKNKMAVIPIDKNLKLLNNKNRQVINVILFVFDENDIITKVNIVQYRQKGDLQIVNIPKGLFHNMYNCKPVNGSFTFLSIPERFLYEKDYENGKLKRLHVLNKGTLGSNITSRQNGCTDWYLVTYIDGVYAYEQYITTTCNCYPTTPAPYSEAGSPEVCDPGSGGGGTEGIAVLVDSVKKELTLQCFISLLSQISDTKLKAQIAKLFQQTYVGGGNINLLVRENSNLANLNGTPRAGRSATDPSMPFTWIIELNPNYGINVSREFWSSVLVHELVHSFISIYTSTAGRPPLKEFEQHETIFKKWIEQMRDFYIELYGMSHLDATSLALGGLDDVLKNKVSANDYPTFKTKYQNLAQRDYNINLYSAEAIRDDYRNGYKGSTCN